MKHLIKDWAIAIGLGLLVYLAIGYLQPKPELPEIAPDFQVNTLEGRSFDLASLRGQTVIINFWASWCGPCRTEIPAFSRFAIENPEIPMIGLAVDSGGPSKVKKSAEKFGIRYPVAIASQALKTKYDVSTLPTTIVVAPDGRVSHVSVGTMSFSDLRRAAKKAQP
jgi:thiol-disulfide isomerase/thioredoxin